MANTTGMATKYLLDMLNIGGKTETSTGESKPTVSGGQQNAKDEEQPTGLSTSETSSTASVMQSRAESDVSLSVGEIPGYLDGSTPRISLHPVSQTIQLGKDNECGSSVYGNQVEVITRQSGTSSTASNKIKFNQMVKYDWELKYYKGNLIATGGQFLAYTLKGRTGYVVRLLNPQTASRALIKGFTGLITDLAFSHRDSNTLACVDEGGNVYVWKITEEDDKIEYTVKLHVKRSEQPASECHRIFWCPYLPDDEDEESDEDDEDRSLAISHDNQVEVIDVAMVIARCGCNEINVKMLMQGEGYVSIVNGHTKTITDGSLSPDNGVLATGGEDGYVKFWQVSEMMPDSVHPCLHEFQPHGGAPISSLMFCDNHMSHEKDVPMWRFMITGAEYNREIKIWCTVKWACLQTLRFTSPSADIESVLGGSYFKVQLDLTARYLVLSDIGRRVLYVLLLHQNREEGQAHISSITDFQLAQSLLSFVITKAKLFQLKSSDNVGQENGHDELAEDGYDAESPDELDESELDRVEKRKNLMVQLRLLSIHTKSLQELLVHLQPEPSVAPPTPTVISSLNTSIGQGARDALSDLSGMETGTEASTDLEESDGQTSDIPSPSIRPKLITPEAFSQSVKDKGRPESSTSSATMVSVLNSSQMGDSVTSSVTSKLSDSTSKSSTQAESSLHFFDNNSGILTPTSLPLPGTPPFSSSAPDPTTVPIPTFATARISPTDADTVQSPTGLLYDVQAADDKETDDRELVTPTPGSSDSGEIQSPLSSKKEPLPINDMVQSPSLDDEKIPVAMQEEDLDNTWTTATTSEQTPVQIKKLKKLERDAGLTSSPIHRVDIAPTESLSPDTENLSSSLGELLQLMKSQQQQISTLRQELRSYQSTQDTSQLLREEFGRLEDRVNNALAQHSASETQRLDKALKERQVTDKKKQEHLTSTLSQAVTNSISGKLDKSIKNEMKNNVLPAIQKIITPVQEQLNTTMAQKLTAADGVLKDSINKMLKNKSIIEAIGTSASVALQGPIQATYREAFQNTIVPAFERACQAMFHQINENFQRGTQQYLEKVNGAIQSQLQQQENQGASIDLLKAQIQRSSSSMIRDVETVMQKQLATAMHSLREEMTARFESQIVVALQNSVKSEVKVAVQELRAVQKQVPVSESIPQQTTVDPKIRISELVQSRNYAQAFQEALTASDLNLVVFVCEKVDSNELFAQSPSLLGQPIVLSLIQQLSVDLLSNTELKRRYLTDAVMALDPNNEVTREHMPVVLQGLCQQLSYAIQESHGSLQRSLKMLLMAAQSLIR